MQQMWLLVSINSLACGLKFRYSEKATKFPKNLPILLTWLSNFQIVWSPQNILTLHTKNTYLSTFRSFLLFLKVHWWLASRQRQLRPRVVCLEFWMFFNLRYFFYDICFLSVVPSYDITTVQQKFRPSAYLLTNHRKPLTLQLLSCTVIGWRRKQMSYPDT